VTEILVRTVSRALERGRSRRDFLSRLALVGSALAVGPIRYLVRPQSAYALVTCKGCGRGAPCCDGWTTFCCTLTGSNVCPDYSYAGGWWKCTSYGGSRYCEDEGVRYYIDCNVLPEARCPDGCGCANATCENRRTCCVNFRYGNCETDVEELTPVVCRVILCRNPCSFDRYEGCSCSGPVDNRTCAHEAACLPPQGAADRPGRAARASRTSPAPKRVPQPEPSPAPDVKPLPQVVAPDEVVAPQ